MRRQGFDCGLCGLSEALAVPAATLHSLGGQPTEQNSQIRAPRGPAPAVCGSKADLHGHPSSGRACGAEPGQPEPERCPPASACRASWLRGVCVVSGCVMDLLMHCCTREVYLLLCSACCHTVPWLALRSGKQKGSPCSWHRGHADDLTQLLSMCRDFQPIGACLAKAGVVSPGTMHWPCHGARCDTKQYTTIGSPC